MVLTGVSWGRVTFDQRPEAGEGRNHLDIWGCPRRYSEHRAVFFPPLLGRVSGVFTVPLLTLQCERRDGRGQSVRRGERGGEGEQS